ncbi:MAG: acyltransferase [Candidatus Melainabacteria bacterium]|nr:acyltransferase [Candidatus Melainabacteria bacterium]
MKQTEPEQGRLESLTSLRFFAALFILLYHARAQFDILTALPEDYEFPQGVTFFFILSGFILTYVYQGLMNSKQNKAFWIRRLARLWPLHLFWLIAPIALLPMSFLFAYKMRDGDFWTALTTNFFLVQTAVPNTQIAFSFNPPAWSISNELFFYAMFPFAVLLFKSKNWFLKLIPVVVPMLLIVLFVGFSHAAHLPKMCYGLSQQSLIFTNPLVRMLDFNLGILVAFLYLRTRHFIENKRITNSFIEIFLLIYVASTVALTPFVRIIIFNQSESLAYWFVNSPLVWLPFSLLILFCAYGKGLVSILLSNRVLRFLGEISFSLYLCHFTIFLYYRAYLLEHRSNIDFLIFMTLCMVSSVGGYFLIEKPARSYAAKRLAQGKIGISELRQSSSAVLSESTCHHGDQTKEPDTCPGK